MSMLSTKGRYATRIMIFMSLQPHDMPVRKQSIAEAEGISEDYVEQILLRLKQQGLVSSVRGARGGFMLAKAPFEISVDHVIEAVEGPLAIVNCLGDRCERASSCATREVWEQANLAVRKVLSGFTIGDLLEQTRTMLAAKAPNYHI